MPARRAESESPGAIPGKRRRIIAVTACALTAAAVLQQLLIVLGHGRLLPGWQPWPFLLGAAPAWLAIRPWWSRAEVPARCARIVRSVRRVPAPLWPAAVLLLAAGVWAWLQDKEPYIGHEEAVYANKARSWWNGLPDAGWGVYRPVGLPWLGRIALEMHPGVGALRTVALALTLFTLATVYLVAARWLSPRRAVVVVLVVLSGLGFLRRVPEFLNDIGATGLLLWVIFLLVRAQENRDGKALLLVPFIALAAFYLRYGVVGNLLAIAVSALLAYGPRAWLARGRQLAIAGGVLCAGLLPHFLYATATTGSPLGIIFFATDQAERLFIGDGLLYYLAIFPYRLAGDLGAVVMTAGLVVAGAAARRLWRSRRPVPGAGAAPGAAPVRDDDRRHVFLGSSAVLICVVLGLATDGEPRFVYAPVVLLTILGVGGLARAARAWTPVVLGCVAALSALTVLGSAQVIAHGAMAAPNLLKKSTVPVALELRSERPCLLVTGYEPDLGWYSGCDAVTYGQFRELSPPRGTDISFVLFEKGRLQPSAGELKRLIGDRRTSSRTIPAEGSIGDATVITLHRGAS
ncbi:ArnT family glycosyltransferase [Streptomyces jumonjinensis]|uniref:ArnT family glycosyltransferase n=1 Tax=Streptomyces jumonjinensis TaxID=1945 RepID=UPI0037A8A830